MSHRAHHYEPKHSDSSIYSNYSDTSDHSKSTAPTYHSTRPSSIIQETAGAKTVKYNPEIPQYSVTLGQSRSSKPTHDNRRPSLAHHETAGARLGGREPSFFSTCNAEDYRASSETYASTVPSEDDLLEDVQAFDVPGYRRETFHNDPVPSTPPDFADLFPSTRRLCIRHDDTTLDGNMNLRVDTEVSAPNGRTFDLTLFHLRMHDLRSREFSLRRYCRESGREVCHSSRKAAKPTIHRRPGLQRSMSNALATFRSKSESKTATVSSLKRHDSGYDSMSSDEEFNPIATPGANRRSHALTNTIKLEFSNYAQIGVRQRGARASKRYEFEYWGTKYSWRRAARKDHGLKEISYHLVVANTSKVVAHIVPEVLTTAQSDEEKDKGGWVPPCFMQISDEAVFGDLADVADVIVSTGLIALVDDCIKRRFHRQRGVQLVLPLPTKAPHKMSMEYVGPKRLIDEVFNRRSTTASRHPTLLRQFSAKA
ncbi:MAG: hypothetical protein M1827_003894 [Pycnora praestabilis]|nr:MAG: hypothetical protein M1827_003894 [Pycnora praestabilis]